MVSPLHSGYSLELQVVVEGVVVSPEKNEQAECSKKQSNTEKEMDAKQNIFFKTN